MVDREEKVLLSTDRLSRVAIVRRPDGLYCIYSWRYLSIEHQRAMRMRAPTDRRWTTAFDPSLYYWTEIDEERPPLPGLYGCIQDAENEARYILGLDGS